MVFTMMPRFEYIKVFPFKVKVEVTQSCSALCNPMTVACKCSSVHGILQARILENVAVPRAFSQPRDQTQVSHIAGGYFTF